MTVMPLTWFSRSQRRLGRPPSPAIERKREYSKLPPPNRHATVTTRFQPLDPAIVNVTISAFFVGRNIEGFWVARDANGQIGGIFLLENSALSFARRNSEPGGCATIFHLNSALKNRDNRLATPIVSLTRLMRRSQQVLATFIGKATGCDQGASQGFSRTLNRSQRPTSVSARLT
jgi:hypothetical protein